MRIAELLTGRRPEARTTPEEVEQRAVPLDDLLAGDSSGLAGALQANRSEWWTGKDDRDLTTSAIVGRCVTAIAQPLAGIDLVALQATPDGEEVDTRDPFAEVFNKGGDGQPMSARIVKEVAFSRMEWRGFCFLHLDRGESGTGPVRQVTPIYRRCQPVVTRDEQGRESLTGYRVKAPNGGWVGLLPSEVLWLRYPDPDDPWGSIAPWTRARWAASLDRKGQRWMDEELTNGNRSAAVVYLGEMDPDAFERSLKSWNRTMTGPRSNGRSFLTAGPTPAAVHRLGMTAREAAYLDTRRYNAEEVALAFGIDRDYLFGESTYENKAAARAALWEDTLTPKLEVIASEVDRQIYPEVGRSAGWDVSEVGALKESDTEAVGRLTSLLDKDALTIDEARAERGLEPLPNGAGAMTLTAYRAAVNRGSVEPTPDPLLDGGDPEGAQRTRQRIVTRSGVRVVARRRRPVVVRAVIGPRDEPEVQRVYDRQEARGARIIERYAEAQQRAVLGRFRKAQGRAVQRDGVEARAAVDEFFDGAYWAARFRDAAAAWLADVWDDGGRRTAASLSLDFTFYDEQVSRAMERRLDVLADQVTATTREAIESGVLARAAEEGLSVDDTAALLSAQFDHLAGYRAKTIARTETVGGFNAASRRVAAHSGVVVRRRWLAASDDRVRDSHARLNGHTTDTMDDPYPNGAMYPGDPSAPASETVNCRCVEVYLTEDDS